jgi:glutamyl-tRNA synthetase
MAVASLAVLVGSAEAVRPVASLEELAALVDLSHISRAPAKFDESELEHLNAKLVHAMPYEAVRERLAGFGILDGEAFWDAVKTNLVKVSDAAEWWAVVQGPLTPVIDEAGLAETAAALSPGTVRPGRPGLTPSRRRRA